jgi:uncharacterized protein (DUF2141 family)
MRYLAPPFLTAVLLSIAFTVSAAAGETAVRLVVTNVLEPDGLLLAGAYSSAETWLGPATVASREVPVAGNLIDSSVTFEMSLPPGNYAFSVLQDLNGNRKLDTNFIGVPTEPSGSSNDAPAKWSAPKFKDAVVTVGEQLMELRITLR